MNDEKFLSRQFIWDRLRFAKNRHMVAPWNGEQFHSDLLCDFGELKIGLSAK